MIRACHMPATLWTSQPAQTFVGWSRRRVAAVFQPHPHYGSAKEAEAVNVGQSDRRNLQWRRMPLLRPASKFRMHLTPERVQYPRSHPIICAIRPDIHVIILAFQNPWTSGVRP